MTGDVRVSHTSLWLLSTPLHLAAWAGHAEVVKMLLSFQCVASCVMRLWVWVHGQPLLI